MKTLVSFLLLALCISYVNAQTCPAFVQRNNGNGGCGGGIDFSITFDFATCGATIPSLNMFILPSIGTFDNTDSNPLNNFVATPNGCVGGQVRYCINVIGMNFNIPPYDFYTVFDDQMCYYALDALPVSYNYLEAKANANSVALTWETQDEQNNSHFLVERKVENGEYVALGTVNSLANQGNASSALQYQFQDEKPLEGVAYYRLKQVDLNGEEHYSEAIQVEFVSLSDKLSLLTYPNPTQGDFNIELRTQLSQNIQLEIRDISGRLWIRENISVEKGANKLSEDLSDLASGSYILTIIEENGSRTHSNLNKQ